MTTSLYPVPQTSHDWFTFILAGKDKKRRPIANNTYVRRKENGNIAIRLHNTDIIVITLKDSIILNTGGWYTPTTRERMNSFTRGGVSVEQKDKIWYLVVDNKKYTFTDGIVITRNRKVSGESSETPKKKRKLDLSVRKYCKEFIDRFLDGKISKPGGGDCWLCLMRDREGKTMKDSAHILQHVEEGYFVSALLRNVIDQSGVNISPVVQHVVYAIWWSNQIIWPKGVEKRPPSDFEKDIARDQLRKAMVKYIRREVGIPT